MTPCREHSSAGSVIQAKRHYLTLFSGLDQSWTLLGFVPQSLRDWLQTKGKGLQPASPRVLRNVTLLLRIGTSRIPRFYQACYACYGSGPLRAPVWRRLVKTLLISAFACWSSGPMLSPASRAWRSSSAAGNACNFVNDWTSPEKKVGECLFAWITEPAGPYSWQLKLIMRHLQALGHRLRFRDRSTQAGQASRFRAPWWR